MGTKKQDVLRRLAVHVEETRPGAFEWVLSEATDPDTGQWKTLKRARKAVQTYKAAMADGLVALQSLVDELDVGPRLPLQLESEPAGRRSVRRPARPAPLAPLDAEPSAKATGRTAFGFGVIE